MHESPQRAHSAVRYAVAIFLSSSLLFLLEPLAGKRLLPLLGGSAAVWTACLVFFQTALLLGYLLAHWLVTRTSTRVQVAAYVGLLFLSLGQLIISIDPVVHADTAHPIRSVLELLTMLIGLPFVTLSMTSPLLQAWYARSALHSAATEGPTTETVRPYRLFAVSNVGSLLSLLLYPWIIEPRLSVHFQAMALTIGFALLGAACAVVASTMWRAPALTAPLTSNTTDAIAATRTDGIARRTLWISLAACASLLLSAVTNHLSQNVAAIPLLWILPLVVYLLTFVIAFGGERWRPRWLMLGAGLAGLGSAGWLLHKGDLSVTIAQAVAVLCGALFGLCLFCHSELYRRRPAPERLTTFYFCVAMGGAIGAILVGVVAPSVLTGNYELEIGLWLTAALGLVVTWTSGWLPRLFWFATSALMASLVVTHVRNDRGNALIRVRNFYGTLSVTQFDDPDYHATERTLYHGTIEHGQEVFRADLRTAPTTYYGRPSGIGLALDLCCGSRARRIGVIGLGAGTLAAYGRAGDVIRFYDIDPAVEPISRSYFTYLRDSPARIDVVTGDARVSLENEAPQRYDVIAVDAFSGDAIPVHLITSQALAVYRRHLAPGGIVAFHVSNRYLDLAPVVQQLADNAGMKTVFISSPDDTPRDLFSADWVLVTINERFITNSAIVKAAEAITVPRRLRLWTDDYNSLLPLLRVKSDSE